MTEKKPYSAPKLVNHGTVAEVTKTSPLNPSFTDTDGGSGINIYNS
jgi:hypothetical protein